MKEVKIKESLKSIGEYLQQKPHKKIRFKLFLSVATVVLLFLIISTYYSITNTGGIILGSINDHGESVSVIIANSSIEKLLSWEYPALQLELDSVGASDSQILSIAIFHEKKLVAEYKALNFKANGDMIEKISPVIFKLSSGEMKNLGEVKVYMSKDRYYRFFESEIERSFLYGLFLLIADTIISYAIISMLLLVPIKRISEGAEIIGEGHLDYRIELDSDDEIGALAEKINEMTLNLKKSREISDEAKNKTSAIIANLVDPVIVVKDQRIMLFNSAAEELFRLTKDDLGRELFHPRDAKCQEGKFGLCDFKGIIKENYISKILRLDDNNFPIVEEITLKFDEYKEAIADDKRVIYKVLTSPVRDEQGHYYGHMKVFQNLTRERRIDNLKSKFITIAAHQLRTPLSGIKWSLNMILNGEMGDVNSEALSYLKETSNANERMIHLVDDLLDIAHIEEGHLLQNKKAISLEDLIREIIDMLKIKAQKSDVSVNLSISALGVPDIMADRKKIKLAIQNIIDNAIKYSKSGKDVTINLAPVWKEDVEYVEIGITDSGIGIAPLDQKKIFSKFFRTDNAVKTVPEGSGFGLFIAKNIILAHQGKVWFESELEEGTTFFVRLPVGETEPVNEKII